MKFGENIQSQKKIHPEWSAYYLDYDSLVHVLEEYQNSQSHVNNSSNDDISYASNASTSTAALSLSTILQVPSHQHWVTTELLVQLHVQFEKITMFVLQQQGTIASEMSTIRNEIRQQTMTNTTNTNTATSTWNNLPPSHSNNSGSSPSNLVVHTINPTHSNASSSVGSANTFNMAALSSSNISLSKNNSNNSSSSIHMDTFDMEQFVQQYEERYYQIGIQLLRLYQFIDVNVTGVRKLLKKHDKIVIGHGSRRKHSRLSLALFWNGGIGGNHMNTDYKNTTNSSSNMNNIHSVKQWSPRTGGGRDNAATTSAGGIYTRRKLSAEAFGNALLQPLLHDEGLTAITATLEVGLQELYALLVVPQHNRNPSDASLDVLWDTTTSTTANGTTYGSTGTASIKEVDHTDTIGPLSLPPPVAVPPLGSTKNHLPPKQPPSRPMGMIQSARVQSRKAFHQHRPSFSSLRSVSTSTILGNNSSSHNTIPGLSSMDSLLVQIQIARRKLQQTNGYIQLLAAPMMMNDMDMMDDDTIATTMKLEADMVVDQDGVMHENVAYIVDEEELQIEQSQIKISNMLNLGSSMLYMCNYYIVAPTSASYAKRLGGKASLASLIIGMTPVAALVSTVLFSWWTNHSYKHALIFASACSVLGNLLYSLGLPFDSIALVMIGRLLTGFGSARSINRRYICDTFPRSERTAASAAFVTASALGMAAGPAIASILHYITTDENDDELSKTLYWQSVNAPGWFMVFLWSIFLICLAAYFEDPPKKKYETALKKAKSMVELTDNIEAKPLLNNHIADAEHAVSSCPDTGATKEPPIWRNKPVMITFLIYFVLKLILEAVLSSAAVLTEFYFDWDSGRVGWYLAILGLLVLPANAVVASLAQSYDDRELITGIQIALFVGCLCMLQFREVYHLSQYIIGTVLLVVCANALEGPNMSLLSQTIPKSWSTGIFNVGLLSTEAGTFGRAMGNVLLTLFGNDGLEHILNRAFGTFSILSFITLYITYYYYDYLEPWDVDD